jgi:acid phosphatase type 7
MGSDGLMPRRTAILSICLLLGLTVCNISCKFRFDSPPVLQNPTPESMTVVWAVSHRAVGWVDYGETQALGKRAVNSRYGLLQMDSPALSVRLENLKPGTTYYYRVGAAQTDFKWLVGGGSIHRGPEIMDETRCFATPSVEAKEASLAVINDTHERADTLKLLFAALARQPADFTVWNGDLFNTVDSPEQIVRQVLRPTGAPYAAQRPVFFVPGNHDRRGQAAHGGMLSNFCTPWSEGPLGYNFLLRQGPLALIGMDTGEDKEDDHPYLARTTDFKAYRLAQQTWLEKAVQSNDFRTAPFKVAVFHIPLYGAWSSALHRQEWGEILSKAGVQLIICGHDHQYRYDAPTREHAFGQLVGGGPSRAEATLILVHATSEELTARMLDLSGGELWAGTFRAGATTN